MEELVARLKNVPDAYDDFIIGITTYAKKKPERLQKVMAYLEEHDNLTSSDIVYFVSTQPDFQEDNVKL